jgi:hypothetical protein
MNVVLSCSLCSFYTLSTRCIINPDYCTDKMGGGGMNESIMYVSGNVTVTFLGLLWLFTKENGCVWCHHHFQYTRVHSKYSTNKVLKYLIRLSHFSRTQRNKTKSVQTQLLVLSIFCTEPHVSTYLGHLQSHIHNCELEDDLNRSKHIVLRNKFYVVAFGRILS